MLPKELIALSEPLLRNPEVRAMYIEYHQMLLRVLAEQGFGDRREKSGDAEVFNCKDGAELLGWDELFDSHTNQMMLLSLTLFVHLAGPQAGLCGLNVRICYPDSNMTEVLFSARTIPAEAGFVASQQSVAGLAQRVLSLTSANQDWLCREVDDFAAWLEQETTV